MQIFYITDHIEEFADYMELISALSNAQAGDEIILVINSGGGRADIGYSICAAINDTLAHVTAEVHYEACSMAALITLACHDIVIREYSNLMFHDWSGGGHDGKNSDARKSNTASHKRLTSFICSLMHPFFSEKEILECLNGDDKYIHWDDPTLAKRVARNNKARRR